MCAAPFASSQCASTRTPPNGVPSPSPTVPETVVENACTPNDGSTTGVEPAAGVAKTELPSGPFGSKPLVVHCGISEMPVAALGTWNVQTPAPSDVTVISSSNDCPSAKCQYSTVAAIGPGRAPSE